MSYSDFKKINPQLHVQVHGSTVSYRSDVQLLDQMQFSHKISFFKSDLILITTGSLGA
jgi:acyl-CoA thioesterase